MPRHERRTEAAREGGLRLGHALLGAGDARGIAREKVIHRLLRAQLRDRRQHAERIGCQHDNVFRCAGDARGRSVRDEVEWIAGPGVLGMRSVVEIEMAGCRIDYDILQPRAEALGRGVDLGLSLARELDHLGVAAALEVEEAVLAPAMFIVADQSARWIGRQGRLARP